MASRKQEQYTGPLDLDRIEKELRGQSFNLKECQPPTPSCKYLPEDNTPAPIFRTEPFVKQG